MENISSGLRTDAGNTLANHVGMDNVTVEQVEGKIDFLVRQHPQLSRQDAQDIGVEEGFFPPAKEIETYRRKQGIINSQPRARRQGANRTKKFCAVLEKSKFYSDAVSKHIQLRYGVILWFLLQERKTGVQTPRNQVWKQVHKVDKGLAEKSFLPEVSKINAVVNYFFPRNSGEKTKAEIQASAPEATTGSVLRYLLNEGFRTWEQLEQGKPGKPVVLSRDVDRNALPPISRGRKADFIRSQIPKGFKGRPAELAKQIVIAGKRQGLEINYDAARIQIVRERKKRRPNAPPVPPDPSPAPPEPIAAGFNLPLVSIEGVVLPKGELKALARKIVRRIEGINARAADLAAEFDSLKLEAVEAQEALEEILTIKSKVDKVKSKYGYR